MATLIGVLVLCALQWQSAAADIDYAKALDSIHETANLLYQRYEFNRSDTYQFFLEVSNMPPYGWDQMKFKIAQKMVDGNSAYTMVFGGSSVTAGHDNYYRQAHPFVFERRIKPLLAAVGVDLVVRNIAQGANNCRPYEYCYDSMGGEGADFIQWEQSFNCGRDRSTFEYMARLAAWSNATLYYMASGGWIPQGCSPTQVRGIGTHTHRSTLNTLTSSPPHLLTHTLFHSPPACLLPPPILLLICHLAILLSYPAILSCYPAIL
jgi:hypothetical protein